MTGEPPRGRGEGRRSRTVTWAPAPRGIWDGQTSNAIDHLLGIRDGRIAKPPLYELLGIDVVAATAGSVTLSLSPDESFTSPLGLVAGGILVTILDTTLAWACDTLAPPQSVCVTVELKTNFLRAVATGASPLSCTAESVFTGSRIIVAQARLCGEAGRLHAIATGTFMLTARKP